MLNDPWQHLRRLTAARIALGRCGGSLPTRELLDFALAHARARDAVWSEFNAERLAGELRGLGWEACAVSSAAASRDAYLQSPDLGRRLLEADRRALAAAARGGCDLAVVVSDGLSALAAQRHAAPLLGMLLPRLTQDGWQLSPLVVVRQGRVAVQDEIGEILGARQSLILLGERPGLGAPDSLGAYLVYEPRAGRTDAQRNCVSNIRPAGLPLEAAATTLHYLLSESRRRKLSGVALKDERGVLESAAPLGVSGAVAVD